MTDIANDSALTALAVVACALSIVVALAALLRPAGSLKAAIGCLLGAGFCFAAGVWASHTVALMALSRGTFAAVVSIVILVLSAVVALRGRRQGSQAARIHQLASAAFEGILIHRRGIVLDANDVFCRMVGLEPDEARGRPLVTFIAPQDVPLAQAEIAHPTGRTVALTLVASTSTLRSVEMLGRPIECPDGPARVVAIRDLTERKQAEQRVHYLAHHDPLTALPNRALLLRRLAQALEAATSADRGLAVLRLDLDRFKAVNELLGHAGGDQILVQVAQRLREGRSAGDVVARLSGDEFAVLTGAAQAAGLADQIIDALGQPFDLPDGRASIGACVGIALFPADGTDPDLLVQNAGTALAAAKESGSGTCRFFDAAIARRASERRQLERDVSEAAARGELELYYQPIADCRTGVVLGYEALLRWNHPERGRVSPADFIPLAEQSGAIIDIGRWVLETACAEAASWSEPRRVAVNLSPVQFRQVDLVGMVTDTLQRTGMAASRLELEITEGVLIADADAAMAIFNELRKAGIRIALDDFGTGYSSMSYLRRFRFDKIKIDRAFVQALGQDHEAEAIVDAILALARGLRVDVTAEGVETERQLSLLRERHCPQVQGYLLGKPMPAAALPASLRAIAVERARVLHDAAE
jgi:diguanylate cyclase (GGDEF)-like protein/PAS domain S-box-containing protein